jgi:hypothetical protein
MMNIIPYRDCGFPPLRRLSWPQRAPECGYTLAKVSSFSGGFGVLAVLSKMMTWTHTMIKKIPTRARWYGGFGRLSLSFFELASSSSFALVVNTSFI